MLLFVIRIKSSLNKNYLNGYISKFFKQPFERRFLKIQLKLKTVDGEIYSIGNQCFIDLNNPKTLASYKLLIIDFYDKFLSIPNIMPIKFIIFEYQEVNNI